MRMAARTAERLAAGRLEERMVVRGEDEIARLASTFNSMAAALQTQIRQLEDLSRVQRRFVSDVTHELRTPLTTVRMAADVLHDGRQDMARRRPRAAPSCCRTSSDRFEELLAELLEICRYDAGAAALEPDQLDLVPLVHRVVGRCPAARRPQGQRGARPRRRPGARGGRPRARRAGGAQPPRQRDRARRGPTDRDHVASGDGVVAVLVRDHGIGLRPGEAGLVFTRFWRGDPSRARTTGGTGLGLAIALEDARLHGGALQAWGAPGRGAAFRLTLPTTPGGPLSESPLPLRPAEVPT